MRASTALLLACCVVSAQAEPTPRFVDLARVDASILVDLRYAGRNNFVGVRIDGYNAPRCLLTEPAAAALTNVQRELHALGSGSVVDESYWPERGVEHVVRWATVLSDQQTKTHYYPSVDKDRLLDFGYIAKRSGHSRGSTVDLTLVRLDNGSQPASL